MRLLNEAGGKWKYLILSSLILAPKKIFPQTQCTSLQNSCVLPASIQTYLHNFSKSSNWDNKISFVLGYTSFPISSKEHILHFLILQAKIKVNINRGKLHLPFLRPFITTYEQLLCSKYKIPKERNHLDLFFTNVTFWYGYVWGTSGLKTLSVKKWSNKNVK